MELTCVTEEIKVTDVNDNTKAKHIKAEHIKDSVITTNVSNANVSVSNANVSVSVANISNANVSVSNANVSVSNANVSVANISNKTQQTNMDDFNDDFNVVTNEDYEDIQPENDSTNNGKNIMFASSHSIKNYFSSSQKMISK